ncbi:MAG TPA: FlgD immunoglobulin-like domain containing protein [Bacteroidia bacterium]|nr:FlgD immunoglobulin-like domain containing protein [Bacteroidia bacterium]
MKKFYTLAVFCAVAVAANAQRVAVAGPLLDPAYPSATTTQSVAPTDTITGPADWSQQAQLLGSINGGYVVGNNGYLDKQKAQVYSPSFYSVNEMIVFGAMYWFGAKEVGANGNVAMRVYNLDGTGTSTLGNVSCPGTPTVSDNVAIGSVDTSLSLANCYIHTFSAPQYVQNDFAVGFDFTALGAGDTIGLVHTEDGNSGGFEGSWEQWSDNSWHTMLQAWPLDIEFAIFPIVEMGTGMGETALNGISVGFTGGNAFTTSTTLNYTLADASEKVTIRIVDAQGRLISEEVRSGQAAGSYTYAIDGTNLAAGVYYVQIQTNGTGVAVPMVKN